MKARTVQQKDKSYKAYYGRSLVDQNQSLMLLEEELKSKGYNGHRVKYLTGSEKHYSFRLEF